MWTDLGFLGLPYGVFGEGNGALPSNSPECTQQLDSMLGDEYVNSTRKVGKPLPTGFSNHQAMRRANITDIIMAR